jgi:hypothetical protein
MLKPGSTYLWKDKSGTEHLWIIISSTAIDPIVTVNLSTYAEWKDKSCILDPGDHEFVTVRSCVMYDEAEFRTLAELEMMFEVGLIFPRADISMSVYEKILDGAHATQRMPGKFKHVLRSQDLI